MEMAYLAEKQFYTSTLAQSSCPGGTGQSCARSTGYELYTRDIAISEYKIYKRNRYHCQIQRQKKKARYDSSHHCSYSCHILSMYISHCVSFCCVSTYSRQSITTHP